MMKSKAKPARKKGAAVRVQRVVSRRPKLPMSLFDSHAVWLEVHKHAPLWSKVTPTQVADVLDAVVAIERKAANSEVSGAGATASNEQPKSGTRQRSLD